MVSINGFFLSSSITLMVVVGTLSEGLLKTFFLRVLGIFFVGIFGSFKDLLVSGWDPD